MERTLYELSPLNYVVVESRSNQLVAAFTTEVDAVRYIFTMLQNPDASDNAQYEVELLWEGYQMNKELEALQKWYDNLITNLFNEYLDLRGRTKGDNYDS